MDFLPIFLNLQNRLCAVIGGGEVASRKISLLLDAGAQVTVCSPVLCDTVRRWAEAGRVRHLNQEFQPDVLAGSVLVIAATDDAAVNRRVSETAKARGIPVNVVDQPELCSFIMPSIVDRSPLIIAVSTGGRTAAP